MPNHLSILGIIHTAISILAIITAIVALLIDGQLNPAKIFGKIYIWLTIITCVTGFPIMKTGQLSGGHYLAIMILVILPIAIYVKQLRIFGKLAAYTDSTDVLDTLFLIYTGHYRNLNQASYFASIGCRPQCIYC